MSGFPAITVVSALLMVILDGSEVGIKAVAAPKMQEQFNGVVAKLGQ